MKEKKNDSRGETVDCLAMIGVGSSCEVMMIGYRKICYRHKGQKVARISKNSQTRDGPNRIVQVG